MSDLWIILLFGACIFIAYFAAIAIPRRIHARVLLVAMAGIIVIIVDESAVSPSFVFWSVLSCCWVGGLVLTASQIVGELARR